ncbi:MAG: hypothetical protein JKX76_08400, partial [Colwellia sp.]|nr:hypothetical protein [Colwellia sp.]
IYSVSRHQVGYDSGKVEEIIHNDFLDYSELKSFLGEVDICFYCLGVYQTKVSKADFWVITVDYLEALINEVTRVKRSLVFCLFSAQGASTKENSLFLFGNAKGRAETKLLESMIERKYIFRPGFINPGRKSAMSGMSLTLYQFIYKIIPSIGIDASDIAKSMIKVGVGAGSQALYSNGDMRRLVNET